MWLCCLKSRTFQRVSIGHALISDALYYGLENTIQMPQAEIDDR
ncbi:MAG: pyridoxine 5'-phosphate synthase [Bacteroidetes bacterium]|nr:pyridoxine 5'-phosphate synthase [Bacteroidota bacterium]